jgi:hypothetical protein
VASTLGGQRCCKAFGRAFGRAFAELRTELRVELLQSFCRALVELNVLKFVTCILQIDTARDFFLDQSKAGLAKFEIWDPKI